ncbi:hypothetical protein EDM57_02605 [Brevibacillus gelatini]|uniref:Uncharacterized protein n=1 Tax=Brevibacillus gelatini TaxID=1655277 RepID=A0A3M8BBF0_9BACL|nr:hypothetical protein EDM57_02605 [Brevibacillus gelatini]
MNKFLLGGVFSILIIIFAIASFYFRLNPPNTVGVIPPGNLTTETYLNFAIQLLTGISFFIFFVTSWKRKK